MAFVTGCWRCVNTIWGWCELPKVQRPHTQWQCAWRAGCQPQTPFPPLQPSSAVLLHPQPLQPCWQHPCCCVEPSSHSLYARIPGDLIRKQAQQMVASIGMSKTQPMGEGHPKCGGTCSQLRFHLPLGVSPSLASQPKRVSGLVRDKQAKLSAKNLWK